jgi:Ca-activated chloride channel family protein
MSRLLLLTVSLTAGVVWAASAGAPQAQEPTPLFKSESDLVVLHVNVFDGKSDAVPGLPQDAFRVYEDGAPQEITFFNSADVPVAVGLVLDNSGSMIARQRMSIAGGLAFARSSHPEDELFTISFNENVEYGLPPGVAFTNRETLLTAALSRFRPGGKTALYDAVISALDHLEHASHQKRVLVVLSDGEDNASRHSEEDMMTRAGNGDAIIYTVSNANQRYGMEGDARALRKLANLTGGVAYFPDDDEEVIESFDEIAGNIRRGYSIGYAPANDTHDGGYRHVKVTVRVPGRSNLRVQSRDGYRPPDHTDAR